MGTFGDWRSGNQNQNNKRTLGNLPGSSASRTVQFKYKYVVGYCGKKGSGTAPTFTLTVGGTKRWSRTLNLKTEDYPYDRGCGGDRNKYSPTQTATFYVPKNTKAQSIVLALTIRSRNLHVVGQGIFVSNCAGGGGSPKCPGDFNGDKRVDAKDLLNLLGRFAAEKSHTYLGPHKGTNYNKLQGKRTMCTGDLQGDGALDVLDLLELLKLFDTTAYKSKTCGKC